MQKHPTGCFLSHFNSHSIAIGNHTAVTKPLMASPKAAYRPAVGLMVHASTVPMAWATKPSAKPFALSSVMFLNKIRHTPAPKIPDTMMIRFAMTSGASMI